MYHEKKIFVYAVQKLHIHGNPSCAGIHIEYCYYSDKVLFAVKNVQIV